MVVKSVGGILVAILVVGDAAFASDVVDVAAGLIGRPYVWGAEGPGSFDCSGLTQYVFRKFDVDLPRRAVSQSKVGDPAGRALRRGDLVFFASDARKSLVTHVGIYEGAGRMIEASQRFGRVRRSNLDESYWVDRFMFARRVMDNTENRAVVADRRSGSGDERSSRSRGKDQVKKAAILALEELAGVLLRRPGR